MLRAMGGEQIRMQIGSAHRWRRAQTSILQPHRRGVWIAMGGGGSVFEYWTWTERCRPVLRAERTPFGRQAES